MTRPVPPNPPPPPPVPPPVPEDPDAARFRAEMAHVRLLRLTGANRDLTSTAMIEVAYRMTALGMTRANALESVGDDVEKGRLR